MIFKRFSFIWNYLLWILICYYFTLSSLWDFELQGYWKKKNRIVPTINWLRFRIYIYIYIYIHTRMLRAILNKSRRQNPTRHQLYGHLPPITKTIQVRRTRHAGHSRDELISDVLLWTPTHGRAKAGRPARTYIQQLCEDTGCCPEDLPEAMNDREKWRERAGISVLPARHDDDIYIYIYFL